MSGAAKRPAPATSGLMDIGASRAAAMYGSGDAGNSRLMKAHIGATPTTTTKDRAGGCMKAIGTTKIMATTTATTTVMTDVR